MYLKQLPVLAQGTDAAQSWEGVLLGRSAVRRLEPRDMSGPVTDASFSTLRCKIAALVDRSRFQSPSDGTSKWALFVRYALAASLEALADASGISGAKDRRELGLSASATLGVSSERFGVSIGAGMGSSGDFAEAGCVMARKGFSYHKISHFRGTFTRQVCLRAKLSCARTPGPHIGICAHWTPFPNAVCWFPQATHGSFRLILSLGSLSICRLALPASTSVFADPT